MIIRAKTSPISMWIALLVAGIACLQVYLNFRANTTVDRGQVPVHIVFAQDKYSIKDLYRGLVRPISEIDERDGAIIRVLAINPESGRMMLRVLRNGNERYCVLEKGEIRTMKNLPILHDEISRHGCLYNSLVIDGGLMVTKRDYQNNSTERFHLFIPRETITGVRGIDVSATGDFAASVRTDKVHADTIVIFDDAAKFKKRLGGGYAPAFSRDGHSVAYCTDRMGNILVYNFQAMKYLSLMAWIPTSVLDYGPAFFCPNRPYQTAGVQWSSDDKWILCSMFYSHSVGRVHAVSVDPRRCKWSVLIKDVSPGNWIVQ